MRVLANLDHGQLRRKEERALNYVKELKALDDSVNTEPAGKILALEAEEYEHRQHSCFPHPPKRNHQHEFRKFTHHLDANTILRLWVRLSFKHLSCTCGFSLKTKLSKCFIK